MPLTNQTKSGIIDISTNGEFMSEKKLTLSKDKVFAGVCGGVAEYFELDPVIVRFVWGISFFGAGIGLLPYLLLWFILPES